VDHEEIRVRKDSVGILAEDLEIELRRDRRDQAEQLVVGDDSHEKVHPFCEGLLGPAGELTRPAVGLGFLEVSQAGRHPKCSRPFSLEAGPSLLFCRPSGQDGDRFDPYVAVVDINLQHL
jgi:hypothetical protein